MLLLLDLRLLGRVLLHLALLLHLLDALLFALRRRHHGRPLLALRDLLGHPLGCNLRLALARNRARVRRRLELTGARLNSGTGRNSRADEYLAGGRRLLLELA